MDIVRFRKPMHFVSGTCSRKTMRKSMNELYESHGEFHL